MQIEIMKSLCLRVISYLLLVVVGYAFSDEVTFHKFRRNPILDGYISPTGYMQKQPAASVTQCGILCSGIIDCNGFFYTNNYTMCQLHATVIKAEEIDTLQSSSDTVYYFVTNATCTSNDEFLECPVNNGGWAEARLPGGSSYMFKLFTDNPVTQFEAIVSCKLAGGTLLKILTEEKMSFVLNNLTKCPSVKDKSYWIDGSNAVAIDQYAADAYKTIDNETVPQNLNFWYPGMPDNAESCNCIWTSSIFSYYLDDVTCYHYSSHGVYHICEKSIT